MSSFLDAYTKTMGHEGVYSFDKDDAGGETYKGISRRFHPSWAGWRVIDAAKEKPGFPHSLKDNKILKDKTMMFYKAVFFEPYRGDDMPKELAMEMFDTAVNMGVGRAVKFLQIALNVLNRNGKLYPDMVEDGDYGPTTDRCLQTYMKHDKVSLIVKIINVLQGNHYIEYMKKSPVQEKYARGWFNRVEITK